MIERAEKLKRNHRQKGRFSCWKLDSLSSCPSRLFLFVCVCVPSLMLCFIYLLFSSIWCVYSFMLCFFSFIAVNSALLYVNASKLEIINLVELCKSKKDFRLSLLFVWNNAAQFFQVCIFKIVSKRRKKSSTKLKYIHWNIPIAVLAIFCVDTVH